MNLNNPVPCPFQHNCHNYVSAKNHNCGCEFDDILECWVELEPGETNHYHGPKGVPFNNSKETGAKP